MIRPTGEPAVVLGNVQELTAWLIDQAGAHGLRYLLAYADDGVIWGRFDRDQRAPDGRLVLADAAFPDLGAPLQPITLQQARLFGPTAEVILRRDDDRFVVALLADAESADQGKLADEEWWLWGTAQESRDGFTLLAEGRQGLRHAPPIGVGRGSRAALRVRHYLGEDNRGQVHITHSRLVDLVRVQ